MIMSRLTNKNIVISGARCGYKDLFNKVYNKLGKLEDLEDELGCPLEVVFKAFKEGVYKKDENIIFEATLRIYNGEAYLCQPYDDRLLHKVLLKDYGKTWWLKGERNEN